MHHKAEKRRMNAKCGVRINDGISECGISVAILRFDRLLRRLVIAPRIPAAISWQHRL